jgi:small-conductance mechanosensitive channel
MAEISRETIEIIVGGFLLIVSFLLSFLMVLDILEKSIALSIFSLSTSFAGLAIGFHGIYGLVTSRRRSE